LHDIHAPDFYDDKFGMLMRNGGPPPSTFGPIIKEMCCIKRGNLHEDHNFEGIGKFSVFVELCMEIGMDLLKLSKDLVSLYLN